ncbi:MAG: NAD(P)H-hydrate dehydratase [Roseburia sp.]|nr:NAD(P)H-hydrate dehydratase [Roseburia sp.]
MQYLVTAQEMKRYDQNTIEKIGVPGMVLMERAALALRETLMEELGNLSGKRALIVAGMGNNGGDGLALGRLLQEAGCLVEIFCVGSQEKASLQWQEQRRILENYSVAFVSNPAGREYNIIVDALFGVGLDRAVEGVWKEAVKLMNGLSGLKLAVDMPSGIHSDTGVVLGCAFLADVTVTFGFCKLGLCRYPGREYGGRIKTADIGINERAFFGEEPMFYALDEEPAALLPHRRADGNKGTFGKALVIAGSRNMAGAAVLAARACCRIGAGMVKVISPEENRVIIQEALPEALYGTGEETEPEFAWADVVAIGPGLSKSHRARELLRRSVEETQKPLVIDADALNLLSEDQELSEELSCQCGKGRVCILTPHVGELARLLALCMEETPEIRLLKEELPVYAGLLAERLHCIVAAKDARTFICAEGHKCCVNLRGNSGMAAAGSGDVLTGVIAGLLAQGMEPFGAACAGAALHGCAGDRAAEKHGEHGCMAGDIVEQLGHGGKLL